LSFTLVVLSENLGVNPVEESQGVGRKQNPGDNRERFIEALEEWGAVLFSPVDLGKGVDQRQNHQEKQPLAHWIQASSPIMLKRSKALLEIDRH